MEKIFNTFSIVTALIGGICCKYLGGWDLLLKSIIALVVLDYITRILASIYTKTLSSQAGFKGLIKKIFIFIVIATSFIIQQIVGDAIPLREVTVIFFICNEGISILENASEFIPIPEKLKSVLIQLRDKGEGN